VRIAVHDYGGYPFTLDLSQELARRGHVVLHLASADVAGPNGTIAAPADAHAGLMIEAVSTGRAFRRYAPLRRPVQEWRYGRVVAERVTRFNPRVVLSANAPLLSQRALLRESLRHRRRFLYWFQDSYGLGVTQVLARRSRPAGFVIGGLAVALERRLLTRSDRVVAIAPALGELARSWGVAASSLEVISNWAPIGPRDDGRPAPSGSSMAELPDRPFLLYAGTLGLKHDVELLVAIATSLVGRANLVVISQGLGRKQLERRQQELNLTNLVLSDFLPSAQLAATMAGAAALVAILRADASSFSVPSKVYAYLAAGRPVIAAIARENEAARFLRASGAGVCVEPDDAEGLAQAARRVLDDHQYATALAAAAEKYSAQQFSVGPIADRFEALMIGPKSVTAVSTARRRVVSSTVSRIWSHPGNADQRLRAYGRYAAWQIWQRTLARPWTVTMAGGCRVRCYPHDPVASAVIYSRLPDYEEMSFIRRYLRAGDTMVDVGANIGLYTLVATSVAGVRVVALEPGTSAFVRLRENVGLNHAEDRVIALRVAAGSAEGVARLSTERGPMNALVHASSEPAERVRVMCLDAVADGQAVDLVKIDVEGAELDVLAGASSLVTACRPVLIVEVNDPDGLEAFSRRHGYTSVSYSAEDRTIAPVPVSSRDGANALLVADVDAVAARLAR